MSKLIIIAILSFGLLACKKEKDKTPEPVVIQTPVTDTSAQLKYTGSFMDGPYGYVPGQAKIYQYNNGKTFLRIEGFYASNGSALHVLVSKEMTPLNYLDLGALQSQTGNQTYQMSGTPDFTQYKYVCIHCVDYDHLFGSAAIQ